MSGTNCQCKKPAAVAAISPIAMRQRAAMRTGRLGAFGSADWMSGAASTVATWGARTAATAGVTAALSAAGAATTGAIAGSVVPIVGTVVGAAVGYFTSKLFGHANQGAILNDELTRLKYADAYKKVAGQIPGRVIGLSDLLMVGYGLIHENLWPQAAKKGVLHCNMCPPQYPYCCYGAETWIASMLQGHAIYELPTLVDQAVSQGITNPITITDQVIIPQISVLHISEKNAFWMEPKNSTDPTLARQFIIDFADAYEASKNPNLPVYYGTIPGSTTATAPAAPVAAPPVTPSGAVVPQVQMGPTSTGPAPRVGTPPPLFPLTQALPPTTPNNYRYIGGTPGGYPVFSSPYGAQVYANGQWSSAQPTANGYVFTSQSGASPSPAPAPTTPTANQSPNGTQVSGPSGTLITAQGTLSFGAADGAGNYAVLLNGNPTGGVASQLAILQGVPVAQRADGSTWAWSGSAWTNLTPATSAPSAAGMPASPGQFDQQALMPQLAAPAPVSVSPTIDLTGGGAPAGTVGAATVGAGGTMLNMSPTTLMLLAGVGVVGIVLMARRGK